MFNLTTGALVKHCFTLKKKIYIYMFTKNRKFAKGIDVQKSFQKMHKIQSKKTFIHVLYENKTTHKQIIKQMT